MAGRLKKGAETILSWGLVVVGAVGYGLIRALDAVSGKSESPYLEGGRWIDQKIAEHQEELKDERHDAYRRRVP